MPIIVSDRKRGLGPFLVTITWLGGSNFAKGDFRCVDSRNLELVFKLCCIFDPHLEAESERPLLFLKQGTCFPSLRARVNWLVANHLDSCEPLKPKQAVDMQ